MLQNTSKRVQKFFLSPFRPDTIISGAKALAHLGLTVAVRPIDCAVTVNNTELFTTEDKLFSVKTLMWTDIIKVSAKKTGKSAVCIIIERINNDSWASKAAYNPYDRLEVFAKERPEILPASAQKTYESMREYKARMAAKNKRERGE